MYETAYFMTDHFRFYPSSDEITIPWNARYSFPSQANKAVKITPRIPPKNGATFLPGNTIRLEFPAQGYVNTANLTFEMDVTLTPNFAGAAANTSSYIRFQNNVSLFYGMSNILFLTNPRKIIHSIIVFLLINMIYIWFVEWVVNKYFCN